MTDQENQENGVDLIGEYTKEHGLNVDVFQSLIKHYDGRPVYFAKFSIENKKKNGKKNLDRKEIKNLTKHFIHKLQKTRGKNGSYGVVLKYDDKYKTSGSQYLDTEPHLWSYQDNYEDENNPNEKNTFDTFYIGFSFFGKKKGGKSENNNCLLYLIANFMKNKNCNFEYKKIKELLEIGEKDMIPLKKMNRLEDILNNTYKLNIGLSIRGPSEEFNYDTKYPNARHQLPIYLSNEHYRLNCKVAFDRHKTRYNENGNSEFCIYEYHKNNKITYCIKIKDETREKDGNKERYVELFTETLDKEEFEKLKEDKLNPKKYLFIKYEYQKRYESITKYFMYYDKFVSETNKFSDEYMKNIEKQKKDFIVNQVVSKLNMNRTGSIKDTTIRAFYQYNATLLNQTQPLTVQECKTISNSSIGGIMWCIDQNTDKTIKYSGYSSHYDFKRYYMSKLLKPHFMVPFREGTYLTITEKEFLKKFELKQNYYGIYKCTIKTNDKYLKLNRTEYTHILIKYLMNLDKDFEKTGIYYKIKLIECDDNFLYYDASTLTSSLKLFHGVMDHFCYLEDKFKDAKIFRNILWGALCEMIKKRVNVDVDEPYTIFENYEITKYSFTPQNKIDLRTQNKIVSWYKTDFARFKPFLLSETSISMHEILLVLGDEVLRVQTDGFITKNPIENKLTKIERFNDIFEPDCKKLNKLYLVNKSEFKQIKIDIYNVNGIYYKGTHDKVDFDEKCKKIENVQEIEKQIKIKVNVIYSGEQSEEQVERRTDNNKKIFREV